VGQEEAGMTNTLFNTTTTTTIRWGRVGSIRSKRHAQWRVVLIVRNLTSREEDNMGNNENTNEVLTLLFGFCNILRPARPS